MKNLFFGLFAFAAFALTSCGGDDCDLMDFTARADANLELGQTYTNDPTIANCEAYKADLDAIVADYGDCDDTVIAGQVTAFRTQSESLNCM